MQPDIAVHLSASIRSAAARFDFAMAEGDYTAAKTAGDHIESLAKQLCTARPSTPQGAAVRLGLAIDLLSWVEQENLDAIRTRLARIQTRLARGRRRETDVQYLRKLRDGHCAIPPGAMDHIRAALAALKTRPSLFARLRSTWRAS